MTKMNIEIGREVQGEQSIKVPQEFSMVSRVHCKVTEEDGELFIQDLSSNGTYVNGQKIKRAKLARTDQVMLGSVSEGFTVKVKELFTIAEQAWNADKTDFSKEFQQLKPIYEAYEKERDQLIKKTKVNAVLPRIIITLIGIGAILLLNIPPDKKIVLTMGVGVLALAVSSLLVKDSKNRKPLEDLIIRYNKQYVCPKCKKKLNIQSRSWRMLHEEGRCPYSKCDASYKTE